MKYSHVILVACIGGAALVSAAPPRSKSAITPTNSNQNQRNSRVKEAGGSAAPNGRQSPRKQRPQGQTPARQQQGRQPTQGRGKAGAAGRSAAQRQQPTQGRGRAAPGGKQAAAQKQQTEPQTLTGQQGQQAAQNSMSSEAPPKKKGVVRAMKHAAGKGLEHMGGYLQGRPGSSNQRRDIDDWALSTREFTEDEGLKLRSLADLLEELDARDIEDEGLVLRDVEDLLDARGIDLDDLEARGLVQKTWGAIKNTLKGKKPADRNTMSEEGGEDSYSTIEGRGFVDIDELD